MTDQIASAVNTTFGITARIIILDAEAFKRGMQHNPYPESEADPKTLYLGFLETEPTVPNFEKMAEIKKESEAYKLVGKVFYLSAPEGVGRSKLAANSDKLIGVPMTVRNWRTVSKIRDILNEVTGLV